MCYAVRVNVDRIRSERGRLVPCAFVGIVTGIVVSIAQGWQLGVLVGWIVTACGLTAWTWRDLHDLDAGSTATVATREDDSRTAARLLLVGASVASLVAVVAGLRHAAQVGRASEIALTLAASLAIVSAWTVVHTVFVLRYAHLYYDGEVGGIEFPGGDAPTYRDFAYVGFTIGMTFQVSDTGLTSRQVRSAVTQHALVSYLFGAAIIAATINVLAGLVGR